MFLVAVKTILVEALRETLTENYPDLVPRRIDIEYPEDEIDWPALLVQFRPTSAIEWTGINPDYYIEHDTVPKTFTQVREGSFGGSVDLTILATTSQERDRLWDALNGLVLMGDEFQPASPFFKKIEDNDLINLTIQKTQVMPVGDTIGVGTPWDGDLLTYEATLRFNLIGQFWMDIYKQELISVSSIQVRPYLEGEEPPGENDGEGVWKSPGSPPDLVL